MRLNITIKFLLLVICCGFCSSLNAQKINGHTGVKAQVIKTLQQQIAKDAEWALTQIPVTVTANIAARSKGGKHDFYSEGDYWWPDPANADSPYIQRDGMTNPGNFTAHRQAMIRFSKIVGALAAAYTITGNQKYACHAIKHCKAWFTDTATFMHPSLLYAQAINGRATGRGIGIIDAIQLIEVAQGLQVMQHSGCIDNTTWKGIQNWFSQYLQWVTTHQYGKDEMAALNNHGTCWVMQVAVFARFTGNDSLMNFCKARFKNTLLPQQLADDGSFPLELKRTKPYGYSVFNLDAMATICQVLSTAKDDLWTYKTSAGKSIENAVDFLYPFIKDKNKWPYKKDVMYWDNWPVAQPFLIFAAQRFSNNYWLQTWKALDHAPTENEVIRNLPVRNPLIWLK
ncbi:alginate lyase family protein [Ferruginibacter profundus]